MNPIQQEVAAIDKVHERQERAREAERAIIENSLKEKEANEAERAIMKNVIKNSLNDEEANEADRAIMNNVIINSLNDEEANEAERAIMNKVIENSLKEARAAERAIEAGAGPVAGPVAGPGDPEILKEMNTFLNFLNKTSLTPYETRFEYKILDEDKISLNILKIPLFMHYNNVGKYIGELLQAWTLNNNNNETSIPPIYLVKNYMFKEDEIEKTSKIEFRPNTFYMKQLLDYADGTNLSFKGKLEIVNLKTNKITIINGMTVLSHDGKFSHHDEILDLINDLEIDVDDVNANNLYYVKFTPYVDTITHPEDIAKNVTNYPIFRAFYCIKMTNETDMFKVESDNHENIKKLFTNTSIKKGGQYYKIKLKKNNRKYKTYKLHKMKKYKNKTKKHKTNKTKKHKTNKHIL